MNKIDLHVAARMRELRIMRNITQQWVAEKIGVTPQEVHKYEKGIDRIAAGRLFTIAKVLGVDVGYFFEGLDGEQRLKPTPRQHMPIELARNFVSMSSRRYQEALCNLVRALAKLRQEE